ncbi:MAG: ribonuclease H-like domain-containing protein [Anaerolineales bacterium]|nr:ribonuclease H-like domain-containing protein [Anaerolineales bacterium]
MPARSLAEKLKSLGVTIGTSDLLPPQPKPKTVVTIEEVMDGRYIATRAGDTFVYENHYPLDYRHGVVPLCPIAPLQTLAQWAKDMRLADLPLEAFAFLDTETSGLSGGTGTYAFMVGAGRFEAGTFRLLQFFMRDPGEEPALLEALADFLAPAQALVTYNGKAFDAPLLVTRYSLHNIPIPFKDYSHVDLLPLARRLWRDRLPSRSLKYIEENVLGAPRSSQEVPGYEIPYLYFDYLRSGDARPLAGVFYHNAMDIVALAALLKHVSHMLAEPLHESIQHGLDRIALAKLFEDLGKWDEAARLYERGLEDGLSEADFWPAVQRLSILQRRRGDLAEAVRLWEKAAAQGHVYACVELAKHHEHRLKDPVEALRWARRAVELVSEQDIPRYQYRHWMEELEHRRERLEGKIG